MKMWLVIFITVQVVYSQETWIVNEISFRGNEVLSDTELLDRMNLQPKGLFSQTEFSFAELASDIGSIEALYRRIGYHFANVENFSLQRDTAEMLVDITLYIDEGELNTVGQIRFEENEVFNDQFYLDRIPVETDDPLDSTLLLTAGDMLQDTLRNRGYMFAQVTFEFSIDGTTNYGTVTYLVNEGPVVAAGEYIYFGLDDVRELVVERELTFTHGDVLSLEILEESTRKVFATTLFHSVQIDPLQVVEAPAGDTVFAPVLISVMERDMFDIQAGGGYGTLGWYLQLELLYRNLFSLGHRIGLTGTLAEYERGGELYYVYPYIFNLPGSLSLNTYAQQRILDEVDGFFFGGSSVYSTSFEPYFFRSWLRAERPGWINEPPPTPLYPQTDLQSSVVFGSGITRDTRAHPLFPGLSSLSRTDIELAGVIIPVGYKFYKVRIDNNFFVPLLGDVVYIAPGAQVVFGANLDADMTLLPTQERFWIGQRGVWPLRGYDESDIMPVDQEGNVRGANAALLINVMDLRFRIWRFVHGAVFAQAGGAWREIADFGIADLNYSAGAGILLQFPFAVARLDYAFPLFPFDSGRFHFVLGPW
ncbi:BamA/TamA family outer membrane protein [Chitinispirillales bacterium ANBcel5]|uniref:BamA/OMP85 family outer membrane protein n=1 Tax=Cellulosispirillum alkaliphilum TaxID=3039283 RepID=UPI002A54C798|nr:BamA/TamA family outer membrane protein [Chitinispirillales bacterium ANBcel5]